MAHKIQINDLVRDATPVEAAQIDAAQAETETQTATIEAKAEAKASALAKLNLTADEAAALFG